MRSRSYNCRPEFGLRLRKLRGSQRCRQGHQHAQRSQTADQNNQGKRRSFNHSMGRNKAGPKTDVTAGGEENGRGRGGIGGGDKRSKRKEKVEVRKQRVVRRGDCDGNVIRETQCEARRSTRRVPSASNLG